MHREFERCRREGGNFNVEFRVHRPDGSVIWLKDQGRATTDENGDTIFIAGACMDITDRKQAEEELREAHHRKDEFLAMLAHELRNPLAPLRNGLQVMRLAPTDTVAVTQARTMMDRQLAHMVRLIDDLMDVSRLNQNKLHLRRAQVLLSDVIDNAMETARSVIEGGGHELTIAIPPEPIFLNADLTRLAEVFSNLLTNSAKYTPAGGSIRLAAARLNAGIEQFALLAT